MTNDALARLRAMLRELFQLADADLDFGIYRVMRARSREVDRFLEHELEPHVHAAFAKYRQVDRVTLEQQLAVAKTKAGELGLTGTDVEEVPEIRKLRQRIRQVAHIDALEADVFAHLAEFFSRYYHGGDFHSRRRYSGDLYAIPYQGEEVKLHWANADQYYIKTAHRLSHYEVVLPGGRRMHFEIVAGGEERDNDKTSRGNERRFQLSPTEPLVIERDILCVRFVYRADPEGRDQASHNAQTAASLEAADESFAVWKDKLLRPHSSGERTLLGYHLDRFTKTQTFDYFIHKDLGDFLRRELDHYLKTEVLGLDDIEQNSSSERVEEHLSLLRAVRSLGRDIIAFLAQLEEFQKRLWLKKKFVLDTHWCVPMSLVPRDVWPEVIANDKQCEAWVQLFAIDKIVPDLVRVGFSRPLTEKFIEQNLSLLVDTSLFDGAFTYRLLARFEDLEDKTVGVLVHSENFHALNLFQTRYAGRIKCIYIDPPYNTGNDGFLYKDNYQHSSWLTMIEDRLQLATPLLTRNGSIAISIDDGELHRLLQLADKNRLVRLGVIAVQTNPRGRMLDRHLAKTHEYLAIFSQADEPGVVLDIPKDARMMAEYSDEDSGGRFRPIELRIRNSAFTPENRPNQWYPLYVDTGTGSVSLTKNNRHTLEVHPLNAEGEKGVWSWTPDKVRAEGALLYARQARTGNWRIFRRDYVPSEGATTKAKTIWLDPGLNYECARDELKDLFGHVPFSFPKPLMLCMSAVSLGARKHDIVLDYHAGSGTTAHAVLAQNEADHGKRRFILIEVAEHFDTILKPRVLKVMYSRGWKDGAPVSRPEVQGIIKIIRLESYDDTLDNLVATNLADKQAELFDSSGRYTAFGLQYFLQYVLEDAVRGSPSLADWKSLEQPFDRRLRITQRDVAKDVPVDVIETFHYLIGIAVRRVQRTEHVHVSWGDLPGSGNRKVCVLWRDVVKMGTDALDAWFMLHLRERLADVDVLYVNGDHALERLRPTAHHWVVERIEPAFVRAMFADANRID